MVSVPFQVAEPKSLVQLERVIVLIDEAQLVVAVRQEAAYAGRTRIRLKSAIQFDL